MIYGLNGDMWITWTVDEQLAKPVYDIVLGSVSMQDVKDRLLSHGYQHVEDRDVGFSGTSWMIAHDNGSLVEVCMFQRCQLSVSIRGHDSESVENLKKFWNSFRWCSSMSRDAVVSNDMLHKDSIILHGGYVREWEGDDSDLGTMIYASNDSEKDQNDNWVSLYHLTDQQVQHLKQLGFVFIKGEVL